MTVVCAVYDAEAAKFWLGSNSGRLAGETITPEHRSKWIKFASWAVAVTGKGGAADVLTAERAKFPNQTSDVAQVIAFIRAAFDKYEVGAATQGGKNYAVTGLIARSGGELYAFDEYLSVSRIPSEALWACGSGMKFALGADMALKLKGFTAQERIETAILSAIDLDSSSPGEPIVEALE